jgi:transposase-like protein
MPGKAAKVTISERQQAIVIEFSKSRSEPLFIRQRATIVLRAFEKRSNAQIAAEVGLDRHQVGVWRRRWRDSWQDLTVCECAEPRRLHEAIREMLRDAPRAGCKGKFTAEQITAIIAVACEPPEKSGRPITHWTRRELRDEVVKRGIVPSISVAQIGRYLNDAALQPHRREMWLNTTEKDPEQFQRQVETVCQTYHEAAARHARDGTHTACIDEMTGLQALERAAPDKPPAPGQTAKQEFEYIRHGTTTLIGTLNVLTGVVFATLGLTRTEPDFLAHVMQVVARDASAGWVFIVDCLNIHWSASLVEWVAQQCGLDEPLGKKRSIGCAAIAGEPPLVSVGHDAPHPLRVLAETQLVAEPDRDGVRHRDAEGGASRQFHVGGRSGIEAASVSGVLQPSDGPSVPLDVHG